MMLHILEKCTREFSKDEIKNIKPGCTYDGSKDIFNEEIARFTNRKLAMKELRKYKSEIQNCGSYSEVTEYAVNSVETDKDGNILEYFVKLDTAPFAKQD